MNQRKTPLFDQLKKHAEKNVFSLHVPGHKNGTSFLNKGEPFYKEILQMDVTEINGMDDLHHPTSVIQEAEQLTSELYDSQVSKFLIGGSTVGNLAAILGVVEKDDTILVQRNCHQSIFHAIELSGAKPIYLNVEVDEETGFSLGVSLQTLKKALKLYKEAKAVVFTNPTYEGYGQDLYDHIQAAHGENMIVVVDEAHGPHLLFNDARWPKTALKAGADLVIQSAHKMLPAMTMTSFLHMNSALVNKNKVQRYLSMLQSSSPSYPLMASLDLARAYLAKMIHSNKKQKELTDQIFHFRNRIKNDKYWYKAPSKIRNYVQDPLKLALVTKYISGYDLAKKLEKKNIYSELASPKHLLITIPLMEEYKTFESWATEINKALRMKENEEPTLKDWNKNIHVEKKAQISIPKLTFLEVDHMSKMRVKWEEIVGQIAAETITPYPPGVPVILKGEQITKEQLKSLQFIIENDVNLQTGDDWRMKGILVVKTNRSEENMQ